MINRQIHIYFLHYGDGVPVYIGKTTNLGRRRMAHSTERKTKIFIEKIDLVNEKDWKFWEEFYISLFKSWGFILENKTDKGRGPENNRQVTWGDKIKESKKGHSMFNEDWKQKISDSLKGRPRSSTAGKTPVPILQYDLNGNFIKEWPSISEARKHISKGDIRACLEGKTKTAGSFVWKNK